MNLIQQRHARGEVATGLLYVDAEAGDLHGHLNTVDVPLNSLGVEELGPGSAVLERINASLRCSRRRTPRPRPSVVVRALQHLALPSVERSEEDRGGNEGGRPW